MANIHVISRPYRDVTIVKMSRFIADAFPVNSVAEAHEHLYRIRKECHDANHNVFAYIIGDNSSIQKYSDDGEPAGTAGAPVLDVMKKIGITNTLLVITRYFGGIKLGTGGLVRAYSQAARIVLDKAGITTLSPHLMISLTIDYKVLDLIRFILEGVNGFIEKTDFAEKIFLSAFIPEGSLEQFLSEISVLRGIEITTGELRLLPEKKVSS